MKIVLVALTCTTEPGFVHLLCNSNATKMFMFILYEQVEYLSAILLRLDVNGICWGFYYLHEERIIKSSIEVSYFVNLETNSILIL